MKAQRARRSLTVAVQCQQQPARQPARNRNRKVAAWAALVLLVAVACASAHAATVPPGFTIDTLAGVSSATAMSFAPDGRLFICEQSGNVRVFKNGALLATPFLSISVDSAGERGLLGIAFDPNFAANQFVYVYYTALTSPRHNRVSRFTANGDVAAPGETPIFDLDNLSGATNHNGGAIHFGPDGKLYIAAGENANGSNSQSLSTVLGKILRINSDGSIPSDNPFFNATTGKSRAIWALGLRNPFTFDFQPGSGRMFINDVGEVSWEEINDGVAAGNYGWPDTEGMFNPAQFPQYTNPLLAYPHFGSVSGCAITGGAFYNPAVVQFPATFLGSYFYADLCSGWIRRFQPWDRTSQAFLTGASFPVDLKVGPDGALYYLERSGVSRIRYTGATFPKSKIGVFISGSWLVDSNGNNQWDGAPADAAFGWSVNDPAETPLVGDWNGSGTAKAGVFRLAFWLLDINGNRAWDGLGTDLFFGFGPVSAVPVMGDWNNAGTTKIGVYVDGTWFLDVNGNRNYDGPVIDRQVAFGGGQATPVVGDWNGSGPDRIGVYQNGLWLLDSNGNFMWDGPGTDRAAQFGSAGWTPITGDWGGVGRTCIGVFKDGVWVLDLNCNFTYDPPSDKVVTFGGPGHKPVPGRW